MADKRTKWFQNKITALTNIKEKIVISSFTNAESTNMIVDFLTKPSILALYAIVTSDSVIFKTDPSDISITNGVKIVFFVKEDTVELDDSNIDDLVSINTVQSSDLAVNFRNQLRTVYEPFFAKATTEVQNSKTKQTVPRFESDVTSLTKDLDGALSYSIRSSGKKDMGRGKGDSFDENDFSGIFSVEDEIQFWNDKANSHRDQRVEQIYSSLAPLQDFFSVVTSIITSPSISGGSSTSSSAFQTLDSQLSTVMDTLDVLWSLKINPPYPKARMDRLLSRGTSQLLNASRSILTNVSPSLLKCPFGLARDLCASVLTLINGWMRGLENLTVTFWSTLAHNKWQGKGFINEEATAMIKRVEEILEMRITYQQIKTLFSMGDDDGSSGSGGGTGAGTGAGSKGGGKGAAAELASSMLSTIWEPFDSVSLLSVTESGQRDWAQAVIRYSQKLQPVEFNVAQQLKVLLLAHAKGKARQTLREMKRYYSLVKRPAIAAQLVAERETLLSELNGEVALTQAEFDKLRNQQRAIVAVSEDVFQRVGNDYDDDGDDGDDEDDDEDNSTPFSKSRTKKSVSKSVDGGKKRGGAYDKIGEKIISTNTPPVVQHMIVVLQLQNRSSQTLSLANDLFSDSAKAADLISTLTEMIKDFQEYSKETFNMWVDTIRNALKSSSGSTSLELRGRLVKIGESDGIVRVQYNERLVSLLREIRYFTSIGYTVPQDVHKIAKTASEVYRHAVQLKQIATFYNSIRTQVIPSQLAMLEDVVKTFDNVVNRPFVSTTSKGGRDEEVTWSSAAQLEMYMAKLKQAADAVSTRNTRLRAIHSKMLERVMVLAGTSLTRHGPKWKSEIAEIYKDIDALEKLGFNTGMWTLHWNHQLYKALFLQFQLGLSTLHETLPAIEVSLIFEGRACKYSPPLPDIRQRLFREIKRFLGYPSSLGVLTKSPQLFENMLKMCSDGVSRVFVNTEMILSKLVNLRTKYAPYAIIGSVDISTLLENHLDTAKDWEQALVESKAKAMQARRLPQNERVDCIIVSLGPLKQSIEEQSSRFTNEVLNALKASITKDALQIVNFSKDSCEQLQKAASTMNELVEATELANRIKESSKAPKALLDGAKRKQDLLQKNGGTQMLRAGGAGDSELEQAISQWDQMIALIGGRQSVIKQRQAALVTELESRRKQMKSDAANFVKQWAENRVTVNLQDSNSVGAANKVCDAFSADAEAMQKQIDQLSQECELAKLKPPEGKKALEGPLTEIANMRSILKVHGEFNEELTSMTSQDWILFRSKLNSFEDFVNKWREAIPAYEQGSPVRAFIANQCDKLQDIPPVLRLIRGDEFTTEHWSELFRMIGIPNTITSLTLKFADLVKRAKELKAHDKDIRALQRRAQGEIDIRRGMDEIKGWGIETTVTTSEHTCLAGGTKPRITPLVEDWSDLLSALDDKIAQLSAMKESQYFKPFEDTARQWDARFVLLGAAARLLADVQRRWVYLEPIFLRGAIPAHQARFRGVDEKFRDIMDHLKADPHLPTIYNMGGIESTGEEMKRELERCQQALSEFLEEKREKFPRFYFIGDDDLLEILGQAQTPSVIQAHLKKLFQGIHRVVFKGEPPHQKITCICSAAGEVVEVVNPISVGDAVEDWLNMLADEMKITIKTLIAQALPMTLPPSKTIETPQGCLKYVERFCSQVLCLAETCGFTQRCEEAIRTNTLEQLLATMKARLTAFSGLASLLTAAGHLKQEADRAENTSPFMLTLEAHTLADLKIKSLIFDIIHCIDVVEQLITNSCNNLNDWAWFRQMRYYFQTSGGKGGGKGGGGGDDTRVIVKFADASFDQTFEYQGNAPRLVHTPLTDKCYLVLTQAMRLGYGGHPYGPAGTGKTESVKALGMALGRQVLVFNCDEGIDAKGMGRIFRGIVKCGAWGCFDEFNRLEPKVLSAISQQIQAIQRALKDRDDEIDLLGARVKVDFNSGIFVTMNPAGKGYGGRSKLPDNLTQLFRSVAMSVPNNDQIGEVILSSEGFVDSKNLAGKLVSVFQLSKDQLSKQVHYDWGLRSLKIILNTAGLLLKRELARLSMEKEKKEGSSDKKGSGSSSSSSSSVSLITPVREAELVIQSLRSNTNSKLTFSDAARFNALIRDVFPNAQTVPFSHGELEEAIKASYGDLKLGVVQSQMDKVIQLAQACDQRMGIVLVGASGCGKTTLWRLLQRALARLGSTLHVHPMNPKALPRSSLLGHLDLDTRKWHDGILSSRARMISREPENIASWLVCDGDIDPEWIESLNSVLDDNRLLTLPSGERIQFQPSSKVNFIFETDSLRFASPATVSRMAVIFLSDEDLGAEELTAAWIRTQPEESRENLKKWMDNLALPAIHFVAAHVGLVEDKEIIPGENDAMVLTTTLTGLVRNGLSHLAGVKSQGEFALAVIRGLAANISPSLQLALCKFMFKKAGLVMPNPAPASPLAVTLQSDGKTLVALKDNCQQPALEQVLAAEQSELLISTWEVQYLRSLFAPWMKTGEHFLLVGPEGAGKHMLLHDAFLALPGAEIAEVHCSSETSAAQLAASLKQHCLCVATAHGRTLKPKRGDRLLMFLSDLHLPRADKYDTVEVVAFAQQLVTYGGFFDSDMEWLAVEGVQLVVTVVTATSSSSSKSGGSNSSTSLSSRFTANVRVAAIPYPSTNSLNTVYEHIIEAVLAPLKRESITSRVLSAAMLDVYKKTQSHFKPSILMHYVFTPRDLTSWAIGIARCDPDSAELAKIATGIQQAEGQAGGFTAPSGNDADSLGVLVAWAHEGFRIFRDRLNNTVMKKKKGEFEEQNDDDEDAAAVSSLAVKCDAEKFDDNFLQIAKQHFGSSAVWNVFTVLLTSSLLLKSSAYRPKPKPAAKGEKPAPPPPSPVLRFTAFYSGPPNSQVHRRISLGATSSEACIKHAARSIQQYERDIRDCDIVMFPEYIDHFSHIDRVLGWPGSSITLVGKCGVGRRTLLHLVAHSHGLRLFTPTVGKWFDSKQLRAFFRTLINCVVVENEPAVLFFEDCHITADNTGPLLLDLASTLIQSQDVHSIYGNDEFESLREQLKEAFEEEVGAGARLIDALAKSKGATSVPIVTLQKAFLKLLYRDPRGNFEAFIQSRVRRNLHVVISLDCTSPHFTRHLRSHPVLFTRSSVLWLGEWNIASLRNVAQSLLSPLFSVIAQNTPKASSATSIVPPSPSSLMQLALSVHHIRNNADAACPRDFVRLLQLFKAIYNERLSTRKGAHKHLAAGVEKLQSANETVDTLSKEAKTQGEEVEKRQTECTEIMKRIQEKVKVVGVQQKQAEDLGKRLKTQSEEINKQTEEIRQELREVQPMLENAAKAVDKINPKDLDELKRLNNPPPAIISILSAVLTVFGVDDLSWASQRRFLNQSGQLQRIATYNPRDLKGSIRDKTQAILRKNEDSFDEKTAAHASKAVAPMALWVKACVKFSIVMEKVQPLESKAKKNEEEAAKMGAQLKECKDSLAGYEEEQKKLQTLLDQKMRSAAILEVRLQEMNEKRQAATNLLSQLSDEKARWEKQIATMNDDLIRLPLQSLLASAYHIYLSRETEDKRKDSMNVWLKAFGDIMKKETAKSTALKGKNTDIFRDSPFSYSHFMCTEADRLQWKAEGLPSDDLSVENAVMIISSFGGDLGLGGGDKKDHDSKKGKESEEKEVQEMNITSSPFATPFIVDPTSAITTWLQTNIKTRAPQRSVDVIQQSDPKFLSHLELAVRWGKILIVQEVDQIESCVFPLLRREMPKQGNRLTVPIGEKLVEVDEKFSLFLFTRNPSPQLPPDAKGIIAEVSFTVTRAGLEAQLLSMTIQNEQPTLEKQRSELLQREEALRLELSGLEKQLLDRLAASESNILEDKALASSLKETKSKSTTITESLKESSKLQADLSAKRETYRPLSVMSGLLYFLLHGLESLNHMYQYSLSSFLTLFTRALKSAEKNNDLNKRIGNMGRLLLDYTIINITRGMFKADRLAFAFHVAHSICPKAFGPGEWDHFLGRYTKAPANVQQVPAWIPPENKSAVAQLLGTVSTFEDCAQFKVAQMTGKWRDWLISSQCELNFPIPKSSDLPPPIDFSGKANAPERTLSLFQRLLLVQAVRPDRLISASLLFVHAALGVKSIDPPPFSIVDVASNEATPVTPILMIVTPGIDPTVELEEVAVRAVGGHNYNTIAMGQGQGDPALNLIRSSSSKRAWVCLKNVHLMPEWLSDLEKLLASITPHNDFRLFLTSEPHDLFPPVLLRQCLKITYEAPPGLKKNMARTFDGWKEDGRFERVNTSSISLGSWTGPRARILFALAWVHAIVQERRTYIPQGWIRAYEFSSADLRSAVDIVDNQLEAVLVSISDAGKKKSGNPPLPWDTLRGLFAFTVYGGRVDNPSDWRVLETYLKYWFSDSLLEPTDLSHLSTSFKNMNIPVQTKTVKEFIEIVQGLPDQDTPSLFKLPSNIEGTVQDSTGQNVIASLKKLGSGGLSSTSGGSGFNREGWNDALQPVISMWKLLLEDAGKGTGGPAPSPSPSPSPMQSSSPMGSGLHEINSVILNAHPAQKQAGQNSEMSPIDLFFLIESSFAQELITKIHADLVSLEMLLTGQIPINPQLLKIGSALIVDMVPASWDRLWDAGPESATLFLRGAARRAIGVYEMTTTIFKKMIPIKPQQDKSSKSPPCPSYSAGFPALVSSPLDLGLFFRPEMLLNAFRQQTARNVGLAIDELSLEANVVTSGNLSLASSWVVGGCVPCSISSLRIQGAQWKKSSGIAITDPGTPSTSGIDTQIVIAWIPKAVAAAKKVSNVFGFPVYLNDSRAKLLMNIRLPLATMKKNVQVNELTDEEEWVLSGACVLLSQ